VKIDIYFLGPPHKKFSLVLLQMIYYIFGLEKCKKECNMFLIILVQDFCPLKIKITQFHGGFRLNTSRKVPEI